MIALVDSDILVYRVGSVTNEDTESYALSKVDAFIENLFLLDLPEIFEWELHLTGKGNFRHDVAVTQPYKGNRKDKAKPVHYEAIRKHMVDKWDAIVTDGMEADDKLAIRQHELTEEFKHKDNSVIVTLDKDLDQVIGWHYNFVKKEMYYMEQDEADLRFFKQFLTGDRIDNIQGVHGIGDKKSQKLLEDLNNKERWDCVVEHLGLDRAIENGHLLYMLRSDDDNFEDYAKREGWL
jgi:hypothetical protein